ncbi:MAG TPA: energy transducer TonB, partial [Candidatus Dormibacteraeota bacterium]|nr:energy transducer TonB [Candidatus Dormibacteraeota bacterium]
PAMAPQISGVDRGVPGGIGGVIGGTLGGPVPPPPPAAAKPKGPIRIFSGMKPPALLYAPPLAYPLIARENHVSGKVVIEAIINELGNVTQARVVSGPGLLVRAALQAVLHRRYAPTILDGQPVPIRFDVTIDFNLS